MANIFWNFVTKFTAGTLARAEDVNTNYEGIESGLDSVEAEMDKAIQITNSPGTTDIILTPVARALKILTFNAAGDVVAVDDIGNWQGNAATTAGTDYNERDLVKDATGAIGLNNIYRANTSFTTTGDLSADSSKWDLVINVADVETAKLAAQAAQTAAETAETGAENQLILFTGQYYGSRTTAQETNLDPNGTASTSGDIYFNSTLGRMKVFNGTSWLLTTANAVDVALADANGDYAASDIEAAFTELASISADEGSSIIGSNDASNYFSSFHTITLITSATNASVTTASKHRLKVGDLPVLSNTDSTPSLDGAQAVIGIVSDYTFTVIQETTVSGANGTVENGDSNYVEDCLQYLGKRTDGVYTLSGAAGFDMLAGMNYGVGANDTTVSFINEKVGRSTKVVYKNISSASNVTFDASWILASGVANPTVLQADEYLTFDVAITSDATMIMNVDITS